MSIESRFCSNHPQRPAIGVCVMTGVAICGECSTRYEGVNYSKQGLELLVRQRAAGAGRDGGNRVRVLNVLAWCLSPVAAYLLYLGYVASANLVATLIHPEL